MTILKYLSKKISIALVSLVIAANAQAAATDVSNSPLVTGASTSVLPNVFLMMDDSGSMGWAYMPDDVEHFSANYGYASAQCNGVYYDPYYTYIPPVTSTGASYPNSSFTAAWKNGYNTGAGTTNLSTSFTDIDNNGSNNSGFSAQAAFYYKYTGAQTTEALRNYYNTSSTFYRECNSSIGSTPGSGVFTKVTVGAASGPGGTDERTNFANWYSYYRTRMLTMKTATGLAFNPLGASYRVGFATMNNNNDTDFLNLATFDAAQKSSWYTMLYSATPGNSTPLLGALARVGQLYARKLSGNTLNGVAANDPVQYSCQQNFAILSTDGFWNSQTGNSDLSGNNVGQQDGTEIRPMYDGASQTSQTVTVTVSVTQNQSVQNTTATTPWTRTVTTVGAACSTPASAPSGATSAYLSDNSHKIALALSATSPDAARCYQLGGSGAGTAWICRGSGSGNPAAPASQSTVTDSTGTPWYLVSRSSTLGAGCVNDEVAFSDNDYSKRRGACPGTAAVSGTTVTIQNQVYNQVVSGSTTTVNDYTTTTTTTVQTINGQTQPPTTTTSGPTVSLVSTGTAVSSDTGAPGGGTTWTDSGGPVTSCMATPPAAGTSTPAQGSTTTANNGSAVVTTLAGPTTTTPDPYNGNPNPNTTTSTSGGTSNTLADIAEYYYVTDLRTSALGNNLSSASGFVGTDVSSNDVPHSGSDAASWQHMTTFTLGLGARGSMVFSPTYQTDTSGDYFSVKNGVQANPGGGVCSWQSSGTTCNWPTPVSNTQTTIDDLWHAAVNGRGTYFSATNPGELALGLSSALAGVTARTGASAAATTSNPNVTSGDNFVFSSTFVTVDWTGELVRQQLDLTTGATLPAVDWAAQALLDANASRTIYTYSAAAANGLMSFTYANLSAAQKAYFDQPAIDTLSQLCTSGATCLPVWQASFAYNVGNEYRVGATWYHVNTAYSSGAAFGATDTANASVVTGAAGTNLVNYLRGDRTNEGILTDATKYFRQRLHILGDIVNAEAVYVKAPLHAYADPGYTAYVSDMSTRQGMVYAAANDGMLHAFYSASDMMDTNGKVVSSGGTNVTGGAEAWAYVPSFVLPNLHKLADKNYSNNHQYFVDGTPISGDICASNCTDAGTAVWKTILVGGLNAGGRGYYALDITNPAAPKALWEFTDADLGLTFGNPEIARLKDGTWVVLLTSGYNNVSPGDGVGRLYVLNANTGALIRSLSTGAGSTGTPSGLSKIIAQVINPETNNTVLQVYGGDMAGNLWRFDVNGDVGAAGYDAQLLITLQGPTGVAQPITTKPQVGIVGTDTIVYVGTGRYLGTSDLADTSTQSIYGIKDPLATGTTPGTAVYTANPHSGGSGFVQQVQASTTCPVGTPATICLPGDVVRTSTRNTMNFATNSGWYIDLPDSGERASTDPTLKLGTLGFTTNVPSVSSCTVGGYSYTYFFDYRTGAPVSTSTTNVLSVKLGNALATRPVYVRLPNNTVVQLIRLSDGTTMTTNVPIGAGSVATRRVSRRELVKEQ